jgi:hypothetical protein
VASWLPGSCKVSKALAASGAGDGFVLVPFFPSICLTAFKLFIIEGSITVLFAMFVPFILADYPKT